MSKEKGDVSYSTSGLLKWQMTIYFALSTLSMRKTIDHVPELLILIGISSSILKVSLSLFVNKNVRTHSTTVFNCFFRVAHREQYREENTSPIALNLASIKIKSCCTLCARHTNVARVIKSCSILVKFQPQQLM